MKENKQILKFESERLLSHPLNEAFTSSQFVEYKENLNSINLVSNLLDVNISSQLVSERHECNNKKESILKEVMISVFSSSFSLLLPLPSIFYFLSLAFTVLFHSLPFSFHFVLSPLSLSYFLDLSLSLSFPLSPFSLSLSISFASCKFIQTNDP